MSACDCVGDRCNCLIVGDEDNILVTGTGVPFDPYVVALNPGVLSDPVIGPHGHPIEDIADLQIILDGLGSGLDGKVTNGGGVASIMRLTQAAYDVLAPDADTLYVIVD